MTRRPRRDGGSPGATDRHPPLEETTRITGPSPGGGRLQDRRPSAAGRSPARISASSPHIDHGEDRPGGAPLGRGRCAVSSTSAVAREAQPQRVVMGQQVLARPTFQPLRIERLANLEQQRLVEVVRLVGRSWSKNQRWIGVSGTGPVTRPCSAAMHGGRGPRPPPARRWSGAGRAAAGVSRSPAWCARATTWMLRIESPPSSKKLSCTPTRSTPSTPARSAASAPSPGRARRARTCVPRSGRARSGAGSALAVDLAVGRQRQRVEHHDGGRAPCSPAASLQEARAVRLGVRRRPARADHVGDQPLVPGRVLARHHHGLRHRRVRGQHRLDLARARCGSRGSSPGGRCGPGTRACRPAASAPGRRSGRAAPRRRR